MEIMALKFSALSFSDASSTILRSVSKLLVVFFNLERVIEKFCDVFCGSKDTSSLFEDLITKLVAFCANSFSKSAEGITA